MRILVCIKQVPDTNEVKLDKKTGTLIRDGVPSIINPDDKNALEEALTIKDNQKDVHVTVITMGPLQADDALREALAMGADDAILLTDRAFGGSDTWSTSLIISEAIKKLGTFDIIFCGRQAIDGDTAQVGPQIAEKLNLPQITYVKKLEIQGDEVVAERALEDGYQVIRTKMPCLLTAIKELNQPRYASIPGIVEAYDEKEVKIMTYDDLKIDKALIGLEGSPTNVKKTFTPEQKGQGRMLEGSIAGMCSELVGELKEKHVL